MVNMAHPTADEVLEAMVAMFSSGDPSAAAEVVAPDYVDHQGLGAGPIRGVEGFAQVVLTNHAAYQQQEISIDDLFSVDDRAVARIRWRGRRHDGEDVDQETIDIIRVDDGRAVEHWGAPARSISRIRRSGIDSADRLRSHVVRSRSPNRYARMSEGDHVAAARAVYDASAGTYVEFVSTELSPATEVPVDHSLLMAFVELVAAGTVKRVADVGCGPGRVTAFLARRGLDVVGVDVSAAMLAAARIAHPALEFEEGQLDDLPIDEGSLGGVVCWYSIIYTPPERLGDAFAEVGRVLVRGGYLLVAFQAGDGEPVHRADAHGTGLSLTSYRHSLGDVSGRLEQAGLEVRATALREPEFDHEPTQQAFVIAYRR